MSLQEQVDRVAELLTSARHAVAFTGAGVSTPSGIPDFRSPDSGLWTKDDPMVVASIQTFRADPRIFYKWMRPTARLFVEAKPNPAHLALAELEELGLLKAVITQNIDGLHQAAGSQNMLELHGNIWRTRCLGCDRVAEDHRAPLPEIPPRCSECGALLRPDVVWFGESLPQDVLEAAWAASARCRLMLIIGTSAVVHPAASLPLVALRNGAHLVEVNPVETPLSAHAHETLRGPATKVLPGWWEAYRANHLE